ncbi:MAG: dihydropteroate synthase, partial [Nitrospirae bacterium]|nr:dihydropteroate synthase [Nitrospirota bacterium]
MKLAWGKFSLNFSKKTYIMGILNVTPDSFADGGLYFDKQSAIQKAYKLAEEGADIIDIGGESTRPGADPISVEEELRRTIPVIEVISKNIKIPISIDTYKSEVAKRALEVGASMVNDISGLRFDPKMSEVVSEYKV